MITIEKPDLTSYQKDILYNKARYTITEASTKVGKTFSHLWWIFEKSHDQIKPGANYWWVAPVYSQAKIAFTRLKRVIAGNPDYRFNETELKIETPSNSTIWFKSGEKPDNLYGEDVLAAVVDEASRIREESWFALRSTLTATKGPCKFIGNVKGKKNWFYKLGQKARGGEAEYAYFKITAYDAVEAGILDKEEIEQAKRDLPESVFRELYLAEPSDDEGNPFGLENIRACVKPLSPNDPVCFGVDLAKSVDYTVIVGLDANGNVCVMDRFQLDWHRTKDRVKSIVRNRPCLIDSTGVGDPIVEDLMKECPKMEGFKFTSQSKQQIMEGLAASLQQRKISVISGVMSEELESFEYEFTRMGVKYSAPSGLHDDTVCALALANEISKRPTKLVYFK
jgi:phage FluMu gp28-like protein